MSGRLEDVEAVPATAVKNSFADVLDALADRGVLAITRHDKTRAIILSVQQYEALIKRAGDPLERLRGYFDDLVAGMQGPEMAQAVDELFGAAPKAKGARARRSAGR